MMMLAAHARASCVRICPPHMHGRTNERTYGDPHSPTADNSSLVTHAHIRDAREIPMLGDVLAAGIRGTGQRYEVVRTGEREPIPYQLRAAVWLRDRGICQKCYRRNPKPWHLDHIVPWSAGGSDKSTNLRVLCEPCNVDRSNFDDGTTFAKRPVTWWCHRCYVDPVAWDYTWPTGIYCPTHRHDHRGVAASCAVERVYRWQRETDPEPPTWHQRPPIETLSATAYCAHCGTPGLTDVTL